MAHALLLQLLVILGTARLCGLVLRHFGQPAVIGEMAAGFVLGPVVMGALFPQAHAQLFAPETLPGLASLSELGLVLFMFVVGAELRAPEGVRAQFKSAGAVGVLGVAVPMVMGLALAWPLYPTLAPAGVGFWPFALFMAAAMSITAFPVMARILKDRNMTRTPLGRMALGSAAIADVFAWIMLAIVVTLIGKGGTVGILKTTLGLVVLVALVFGALKPLYAWLLRTYAPDGRPGLMPLTALVLGAVGCAALTQWMGLHAVFGAFLFGACLPRDDKLLQTLTERLETPSLVLLMPIFFALAGLNTSAGAFASTGLTALALILVVAITGKIVGGTAGARLAGHNWRDSLALGSLMNARGMMELIVMKVGLDAGLIGPELFTMLLVMALLTTVMTGPLLNLFAGPAPLPSVDGNGSLRR